jgi:drug/metabolite transporter (DMT)-like permease
MEVAMRHVFLAILSAFLFGVSTPLGKVLLSHWSPQQLAGLLYLGAAIGVFVPMLLGRRGFFSGTLSRTTVWRLSGAILFGGILGPVFLLAGLKLASASSVSLWLNLEMVATAFLGILFFRDHLGKSGWVGAVCIFAAGVLLSLGEGSAGLKAGIFLALACICWGVDNNLTALIDGLLPMQSTFWKGLVAGLFNLGLGFWLQPPTGNAQSACAGLALGAVSYGASIALYIGAAQALGAARSQMIFASGPLFGLLLSQFMLKEPFHLIHGLALVFQAAGIFLLFRDKHEHAHTHLAMDHTHSHSHDDGHHTHIHEGEPSSFRHSHRHTHEAMAHRHPHWPDIHHRHEHGRPPE